MEKTIHESEQQADIIKMIGLHILMLDVEYCRDAAKDMINQAHRQESIAVLNPMHPQVKNDILRVKGQALLKLCEYVDLLKEADRLGINLLNQKENTDNIMKMFI